VDVQWHDFLNDQPSYGKYQEYAGSNNWDDIERDQLTYSPMREDVLVELFNAPNWDSAYKYVSLYDQHSHEVSHESFFYNSGWGLTDGEYTHYSYDGNGHTTEKWNERYDSGLGANYNVEKFLYANFFVGTTAPQHPTWTVAAYPNPCTDLLNFDLQLQKPSLVTIELYDLQGRLRCLSQVGMHHGFVTLPVSEMLEGGVYVYRVRAGGEEVKGRVLVER